MATLTETRHGDVTLLRIAGGLTFEGVTPVSRPVESATGGGRVVIDLTDVPVVTTPGLSLLLGAQKRLTHAGGRLVLSGLTPNVQDLLRRCRLDRVFTIAPDADAAVATLAGPAPTLTA
ncbi:MAG TPA: STAS domain-containing protein [Humisphaera sp.]